VFIKSGTNRGQKVQEAGGSAVCSPELANRWIRPRGVRSASVWSFPRVSEQCCSDSSGCLLISLNPTSNREREKQIVRRRKYAVGKQMNTQTAKVPLSSDIIERAQAGDPEVFADLFDAHKARIYGLCLCVTRNAAEADDLTQDAFLQAFRRLSAFRGQSTFATWLHRIAVNIVLMHFRKKMLHQVLLDEPSEDDGTPRRECAGQDHRLSGTVDRLVLIRALQELPARYRMMFLLHEVHGYEHGEIADLLDCSTGNSKSQLHRAKLRIRQILARTHPSVEEAPACGLGVLEADRLIQAVQIAPESTPVRGSLEHEKAVQQPASRHYCCQGELILWQVSAS
jgi:RNA polymerase sigma-70 factor, ECF subfamily